MKEVPVKIEHNKEWIVVKLGVGEDRMVFPAPVNKEIVYKTISDVAEKKNVLIITVKSDTELVFKILSVEKVLQILKKLILGSCNAYRLMAYFISPAKCPPILESPYELVAGDLVAKVNFPPPKAVVPAKGPAAKTTIFSSE